MRIFMELKAFSYRSIDRFRYRCMWSIPIPITNRDAELEGDPDGHCLSQAPQRELEGVQGLQEATCAALVTGIPMGRVRVASSTPGSIKPDC